MLYPLLQKKRVQGGYKREKSGYKKTTTKEKLKGSCTRLRTRSMSMERAKAGTDKTACIKALLDFVPGVPGVPAFVYTPPLIFFS